MTQSRHAHTAQPAHAAVQQHPAAFQFGLVIGGLMFLAAVGGFMYVAWRILKAMMGYRIVTVKHGTNAPDDRIDDLWR